MDNIYRFNCQKCEMKCDGISKGSYIFSNDVDFSEHYEKIIIEKLIIQGILAKKTSEEGYPDIALYKDLTQEAFSYIEVKVQRRTFMSVARILPESNLLPSETLALNLSDLLRYFQISDQIKKPIYLTWVLAERPCVLKDSKVKLFYQEINELRRIYDTYGEKRRFRRKSGIGDVVNGEHKGVVVNYHFSINELMPFKLINSIE